MGFHKFDIISCESKFFGGPNHEKMRRYSTLEDAKNRQIELCRYLFSDETRGIVGDS